MSRVLGYLVVGVALAILRFAFVGLVCRVYPSARAAVAGKLTVGTFFACLPFWPLDALILLFQVAGTLLRARSAYVTARRLSRGAQ